MKPALVTSGSGKQVNDILDGFDSFAMDFHTTIPRPGFSRAFKVICRRRQP